MVESGGNSHHHHHVRTVASAEDYPLERLADPLGDRPKPDVPRPPRYPMSIANLYKKTEGKPIESTLTLFTPAKQPLPRDLSKQREKKT